MLSVTVTNCDAKTTTEQGCNVICNLGYFIESGTTGDKTCEPDASTADDTTDAAFPALPQCTLCAADHYMNAETESLTSRKIPSHFRNVSSMVIMC